MRIIFFFKMFEIWCRFEKWNKEIRKFFFFFQITEFQFGVANSQNIEQETCHRISMSSKTLLRFHLTLGATFSKSTSLTMMKIMKKALSRRFRKYFGRFHMFIFKACSETALFGEWTNQDFHSLWFQKCISYDNQVFFQNV